jgi:hypothetical protein
MKHMKTWKSEVYLLCLVRLPNTFIESLPYQTWGIVCVCVYKYMYAHACTHARTHSDWGGGEIDSWLDSEIGIDRDRYRWIEREREGGGDCQAGSDGRERDISFDRSMQEPIIYIYFEISPVVIFLFSFLNIYKCLERHTKMYVCSYIKFWLLLFSF